MSDIELESEVSRFIPFFYPASQSTPPNVKASADALINHLKAEPEFAGSVATDLPTFLLYVATNHPSHTDQVLQATKTVYEEPSLPRINNWDSSRPNATFEEMFHVSLRENVNDEIRGPIEAEERKSFVGASLLAARARSLGLLDTPEIVGNFAEGLGFCDEKIHNYEGEVAEIAAAGACVQVLGGLSSLVEKQPKRFAKGKVLTALNRMAFPTISALIEFAKSHVEREELEDLTSEAIVEGLKNVGWRFPGAREVS
ncbi:hypothetical protein CPC08DRAFT_815127 [Agrocybe pediades]|nr:hypothetical protein CPC08DRAFT_815127 [Agrocybe pediades]